MTTADVAGLLILAAMAFIIAAMVLVLRKRRHPIETHNAPLQDRDEEHESKLLAVSEWLSHPPIIRAILRSQNASVEGLEILKATIGQMPREQVDEAVAILLADRNVRRVICEHVVSLYKWNQGIVMKSLLDWAKKRVA